MFRFLNMLRKLTTLKELFFAITLLVTGSLVYVLFRDVDFLNLKHVFSFPDSNSEAVLIYTLPDMLWLYALLTTLKVIWKQYLFTIGKYWFLFISVGTFFSEVSQKIHFIPGTFDWLDVLGRQLHIDGRMDHAG